MFTGHPLASEKRKGKNPNMNEKSNTIIYRAHNSFVALKKNQNPICIPFFSFVFS